MGAVVKAGFADKRFAACPCNTDGNRAIALTIRNERVVIAGLEGRAVRCGSVATRNCCNYVWFTRLAEALRREGYGDVQAALTPSVIVRHFP